MEQIVNFLISLNLAEWLAKLIANIVFAIVVAVAAPGMLVILTWLERKIIGRIQDRLGPNRAGPFGLFQAFADMIKMFTKEDITPAQADRISYNIAPGLAVIAAIMPFAIIPFAPGFVGADLNVGLLYIIAIGGLSTLAVLIAGWSSNNKYSLLGAFRAVGMMLSYEIPMVLTLVIVAMVSGSMSLAAVVEAQTSMWYVISMPVVFIIFFLSGVAEVGRSPFDLVEGESELIAGFHTEYSGMKFGMFMIGEYVHMLALAFFTAVLFFGGWHIPFINVALLPFPWGAILGFIALMAKVFFFIFVMMWLRGTLPRIRIDHMQDFGWKFLIPLTLALLIGSALVARLFSPGSELAGPGPLAGLGVVGEIIFLLVMNLAVLGAAFAIVAQIARRSRSKALRTVSAVEPVTPSS